MSPRVKSFDHVSIDDFSKIIPCDVADVSEHVNDGGLNVIVFSLSLMGKNWKEYLQEAHRCLHEYGLLCIAETTNQINERLIDLKEELEKLGFRIETNTEKSIFTFIEAIKLPQR
uniref:SAM-dependent methyltransferase n=1 Tax=uncultured marine thaumarchaeote KM3_25_G08 TaxID=1456105 RepID=A0A075H0C8_9ARCH|nr:SAM-dependent methyltransferase [uncultured marine thaumarchaeote KM3_25_G08]